MKTWSKVVKGVKKHHQEKPRNARKTIQRWFKTKKQIFRSDLDKKGKKCHCKIDERLSISNEITLQDGNSYRKTFRAAISHPTWKSIDASEKLNIVKVNFCI